MIQLFFENNKKTKEKIDIFKKALNIYQYKNNEEYRKLYKYLIFIY